MRFFVTVVQFAGIIFALGVLRNILPECCNALFTSLANIFFSVYLAAWIVELTQEYLLTSRISAKNKAVVVTGCDSGFGNALAERLDKRGFKVYACCLDPAGGGAQRLKDTCSNLLQPVHLDVTNEQSVQRAEEFLHDDLKGLDLWAVVNNAGVLKGFQIELTPMKDFEDCMQVNALGPVRITRAFLPLLRKSQGRVINVCSMSGRHPLNFMAAYTMSKHAAVAFTEVAMQEFREFGIRVISVEPEFFKTPMCTDENVKRFMENAIENVDDEIKAEYGKQYIDMAIQSYLKLFSSASLNTHLVLDAIEDGITLKYPADIYKPCGSLSKFLIFFFAERLPKKVKDVFYTTVLYLIGLPKPKSGVNFLYRFLNM